MRIAAVFCIVAWSLSALTDAVATDYAPFPPTRYVDANGRYYVVASYRNVLNYELSGDPIAPVDYVIVEAHLGSSPVTSKKLTMCWQTVEATGGEVFFSRAGVRKLIRGKDRILATFSTEYPPGTVLVSSAGKKFFILDNHGPTPGHREGRLAYPSVVCISLSGEERFTRRLDELFSEEEIRAFPIVVDHIDWLRRAWLDENTSHVVLETTTGTRKYVAFENDGVSVADK